MLSRTQEILTGAALRNRSLMRERAQAESAQVGRAVGLKDGRFTFEKAAPPLLQVLREAHIRYI